MKTTATQEHKRPFSPHLTIYRWRLTMLASIAHRASGVWLVLTIPILLWLLLSISHDLKTFNYALSWLHQPYVLVVLWLSATALFYHFVNGLRFLSLDLGFGESRAMMKLSAKLVLIFTSVFAVLLVVKYG